MLPLALHSPHLEDTIRQLENSWLQMIEKNRIDRKIRPVIAESWKRSLKYGVPFDKHLPPSTNFENELQRYEQILEIANPIINRFRQDIEDSGYFIMVSDAEGLILRLYGKTDQIEKVANQHNTMPGIDFSERNKGTNIIALCLNNNSSNQIFGAENFAVIGHSCVASGAPLRDPLTNRVVGTVAISSNYNILQHSHSLIMVKAIGFAIEQAMGHYIMQKFQDYENKYFNSDYGLIIICDSGQIVSLNTRAMELLKLDYPKPENLNEITSVPELNQILFEAKTSNSSLTSGWTVAGNGKHDLEVTAVPIRYGLLRTGFVLVARKNRMIVIEPNKTKTVMESAEERKEKAYSAFLTKSPRMHAMLETTKRAALSSSNILLLGESGTGKELLAKAIHDYSPYSEGPFVPLNCGCIPRDLIASELFGYTRGSFTGAAKTGKKGKFEIAAGGTLFLDEIGDMPLDIQVALLRVLEERIVYPIGADKGVPVSCRVIAATNQDLLQAVKEGNFRSDLYYRLNVLNIRIPPLRERREDILFLAAYFCRQYGRKMSDLDPQIREMFLSYPWPGNVRELKNTIERLVCFSSGGPITRELLPDEILAFQQTADLTLSEACGLSEQEQIKKALSETGHNVSEAARKLGISRSTLYRKMKKYQ
ncbi:MAG: sigma-54-dependent Fis family transcriptional regulator [Firmicutes bacterium]|jgi:transcriptional regulator of acetoin/glycerol metabolism|nr:sigma-54-dependent Fis family transcriptional regulator [Bacillota bacterium]